MTQRARDVESLLVTMFAAVPLYLTHAVGTLPLVAFHLFMAGVVLRVAAGKGPELVPATLMRWIAIGYVPFYVLDAAIISRGAIAASTHLVLFIAAYQPVESMGRDNQAQRMLTTTLIFIASLATSTDITVVLFVLVFGFFMMRQLMHISHLLSARSLGHDFPEPRSSRAAAFYLAGAAGIAALLFPLLPRIRNPLVQGITGSLPGATTALSDTIDFREPRVSTPDTTVVARIWMDEEARPFFTPVRLRGTVYDRFDRGEWRQTFRGLHPVTQEKGSWLLAQPHGSEGSATVQLRPQKGKLFLPVGTYAIRGVSNLFEGPTRETFFTYQTGMVNLDVRMAYAAEPLRVTSMRTSGYPISPAVAALAHRIVGNELRPDRRAALIETYMTRNFRYVPNPASLGGQIVSVDEFLLRRRSGHCEYFAAGMVALLTALDVPARIAGGFYGGRLNPLGGYYTIRRVDAHAWTEVWDGQKWLTFDSTPPSLRPGSQESGALSYLSAVADSVNYFWDRYVLTFGLGDQISLFTDAFTWIRETLGTARARAAAGLQRLARASYSAALVILAAAALAVLLLARRRRPLFHALAAAFGRYGIVLGSSMTAREALAALEAKDAAAAAAMRPLIALYEEEEFAGRSDRQRRRELRRGIAELQA